MNSTRRPCRTFVRGLAGMLVLWASCATAAITGDEIRVGLLLDLSSIYANLGGRGSEIAARMAIEDAGGSLGGKPIRLVVADHANHVERAEAIALRWLDDEGVDVIADVTGSPAALAVQEIARSRDAVVFYNGVMTTALTGARCAPNGIHWMYDGYAFTTAIGRELTRRGVHSWYFLTVDNAFGQNVEQDLAATIRASGGEIRGGARHRLGEEEFFTRLRAAADSGADAIALVNAGEDLNRAVRQSYDLHAVSKGRTVLAAVATTLQDVHRMKPQLAQGLKLAHAFYWNRDAESRAWSERFHARAGAMPNDMQAGVYSALVHYFKAVAAAGEDRGMPVVTKMRELPIRDPIVRNAHLRPDGRMVHDTYLMEVKKPGEVHEPWDYLRILRTIPAEQAFRPLAESECPLVKR